MVKISAKVSKRFSQHLNKMKKVINLAVSKDINEADTVTIVVDILSEIFGYDKYSEITKEYAIRNTYCDLAIKIADEVKFLIEVKAVGIKLNNTHIQQAVSYGANLGVDWVILTNAATWRIYGLRFEKPVKAVLIEEFDFNELNTKKDEHQNKLFNICKEGLRKDAMLEFSESKKIINKFFVGAILQSDAVSSIVKKWLKKVNPKIKVDSQEILQIVHNEIVKRDLLESEEYKNAVKKLHKISRKKEKQKEKSQKNKQKKLGEPQTDDSISL